MISASSLELAASSLTRRPGARASARRERRASRAREWPRRRRAPCHELEPGFVIQGGDPDGNGEGGPGYTIPDEKSGLLHVDGALAMAKTDAPNSAGSQFYITLAAQPSLDKGYTVFGKVTAGKEVTTKITTSDTITKVTIDEK